MPRLPGVEFMTSTANGIDGYDVVQTFGVVRGIVVRSRSVFGQIGVRLQTILGGNITLLTELCEHCGGTGRVTTLARTACTPNHSPRGTCVTTCMA